MTSLHESLVKQISLTGPMVIADYMRQALLHPRYGYYQRQTAFGAKGDFITAPDISQMFGEILGLWLLSRWQQAGAPRPFILGELGPGRGRLMADMLRIFKRFPDFYSAFEIHLIEAGARRRHEQKAILKAEAHRLYWHETIADLPQKPLFLIANEFFDALPIHQFVWQKNQWFERALTTRNNDQTNSFTKQANPEHSVKLEPILVAPGAALALKPQGLPLPQDGDILEINPSALQITSDLAKHIAQHGGSALFVDYGYEGPAYGDSLQAIEAHHFIDPFEKAGLADLTAHVAFAPLLAQATLHGAHAYGPLEQGAFLMGLGMGQRASQLAKDKDKTTQQVILSALQRLTAPDQMGTLFKVAAIEAPLMPPAPLLAPYTAPPFFKNL